MAKFPACRSDERVEMLSLGHHGLRDTVGDAVSDIDAPVIGGREVVIFVFGLGACVREWG